MRLVRIAAVLIAATVAAWRLYPVLARDRSAPATPAPSQDWIMKRLSP